MALFQLVKGTEDYYPEDNRVKQAVFDILRTTATRHGFQEIDTSPLATTDLLTAKSGDEIKQQIFILEKRSTEEIGLRFDLTIPMTRMFAARAKQLPKPVKWFALDKNWRYEAPQRGRQREFYQLSVELFGSDKPEADAETINLLLACLRNCGLTARDITLKINNRKLLEGLLRDIIPEKAIESAIRIIDKSAKLDAEALQDALADEGITPEQIERINQIIRLKGTPAAVLKQLTTWKLSGQALDGYNELKATLDFVPTEFVTIDLSIARGLAYYTGNVYEVHDRAGTYRALAGGGRYDSLVKLLGGEHTPATGFGLGWSTLSLLLAEKKLLPVPIAGPEYYLCPVGEEAIPEAIHLAEKLRTKTSVDIDLMRRKLGKQFDHANAIGAKHVIILGPEELKKGNVKIKDMTTGKETIKHVEDL